MTKVSRSLERSDMFDVEYVTPSKRLASQPRASFTGAHTLARMLMRKGCRSVSITDPKGNEIYFLNGQYKVKH